LYSPDGVVETGLPMSLSEKSKDSDRLAAVQSVLCSPVCQGIIATNGHISRISRERTAEVLCT
jgi:hypothetical protein